MRSTLEPVWVPLRWTKPCNLFLRKGGPCFAGGHGLATVYSSIEVPLEVDQAVRQILILTFRLL
jgi:hypothetical protein